MRAPVKVLFVCIGNSCRSQMAEALARHWASDVIEASSAGISALGQIESSTLAVLKERGVPASGQYSKPLLEADCKAADLVVNMTGRPGKSVLPWTGRKILDWHVTDPYGQDLELYRRICDEIDERVAQLADRLREDPALVLGGRTKRDGRQRSG
jgi:arsenate reductase (thioredoxin)